MLTNELNEQEIRNILDRILKRREFHKSGEKNPILELISNIWEAIQDWIRQLFKYNKPNREIQISPNFLINSSVQAVLKILLILIASLLLFLLIRYVIKRVYLPRKIKELQVPNAHDYLTRPGEAMEKYYQYMASGDYSEALRFLFIAVLLELDRRKIIKIEKWKTNRMYIREIGLKDKELIMPMKKFSTLFNACCYGNRTVDEVSVKEWFEFYTAQKERQE